jgi:hypothetical protein
MSKAQSDAILKSGKASGLSEDEIKTLVRWKASEENLDPQSREICDFFIGKTQDDEWKMQIAIEEYNVFLQEQQTVLDAKEVFKEEAK